MRKSKWRRPEIIIYRSCLKSIRILARKNISDSCQIWDPNPLQSCASHSWKRLWKSYYIFFTLKRGYFQGLSRRQTVIFPCLGKKVWSAVVVKVPILFCRPLVWKQRASLWFLQDRNTSMLFTEFDTISLINPFSHLARKLIE